MKDKKKVEILLKVIERVYTKSPEKQKLIDESMIDLCKEEIVIRKGIFFTFLCCWLYRYGLSKHKFLCLQRAACENIRVYFIGNQEKNHTDFLSLKF